MASAGIPNLVKTVRSKAKFKQLAMFSIKAITKACAFGFRDWELNLAETIEEEGVEALLDVLSKHPGHPGIMREVMECLECLLTDSPEVKEYSAEAARRVAAGGGVKLALDSMNKDKTYMMGEVGDKLFTFLKLECNHNPEAVLDGGGGAYCMEVLPTADPWASAEIFATLDSLCGADGDGARTLADNGVIAPSLDKLDAFFANPIAGTEPAIEAGFTFFAKMCLNFDCHAQLNEAGALDRIIDIVDVKWENKTLLKLAGQMMSRLSTAGGDGEGEGGTAKGAWSEEKKTAMENSAMLVAQMAAGRGKADAIMKGSGAEALVACLNPQSSAKTVEASARGIARLASANHGQYIKRIAKAKCIPPLIEQLNVRFERVDPAAASLTAALAALCMDAAILEKVAKAEGIQAVVGVVRTHPYDLDNAVAALHMIEVLAIMDYDMEQLVDEGCAGAVIAVMGEHPQHAGVQSAGANGLLYMATDEETVEGLLEDGALEKVLANLAAFPEAAEVHHNTLYLLASLALVEPALEAMKAANVVGAVAASLRMHAADRDVRVAARDLVEAVVQPHEVQEYMGQMEAMVAGLTGGEGAETEEIAQLAFASAALSVVPDNLTIMMQAGVIGMLASTLKALAGMPSAAEGLEESMTACCYALTELGQAGLGWDAGEVVKIFTGAEAVPAVVTSMKGHPGMVAYVAQAAAVLRTLAGMGGLAAAVVSGGGVEACAYTMRANEMSVKVISACSLALLEVAQSEEHAVAIAKRGGTKQLLASLLDGAGKRPWAGASETMLNVLESVGLNPEGRDEIATQDGVTVVATVLEKFEMYHDPSSLHVVDVCRHLLAALCGSSVVAGQLAEAVDALSKHKALIETGEHDVAEVLQTLDLAGALALAGVLVDQAPDAPGAVLGVMSAASEALEEGDEDRAPIMGRAARALGEIGAALPPAEALEAVGLVMAVVRGESATTTGTREAVTALKGLVANPLAVEPLIAQGGVETLMDLFKQHQTDELMLHSLFGAMAQIARHEQGLAKLVAVGAVPAVATWLQSRGASAGSGAVAAALEFLIEIAGEGAGAHADGQRGRAGSVSTLQAAGIDAISTEMLQAFCGGGGGAGQGADGGGTAGGESGDLQKHANPIVLGAVCELYERMARHDSDVARALMEGGQVRVVLELLQEDDTRSAETEATGNTTATYFGDRECMLSTMGLLRTVAAVDGLADPLIVQGGRDVIFGAMSHHRFDDDLLSVAAAALGTLEAQAASASPAEAADAALTAFEAAAEAILAGDGSESNPDALAALSAATAELTHRLHVPESAAAVAADRVAAVMPLLTRTLETALKVSSMPGGGREVATDALAPIVLCLGRIAAVPGAQVGVAAAVPVVARTLGAQPDAVGCEAIFALGQFATDCDTPTVMALSSVGAVKRITRAMQATRTRKNAELRRIAGLSMEKIKRALQEHAGDLVHQEGGTEAVLSMLEATAYDAVSLTECVEAIFEESGGSNALLEVMCSDGEGSFGVQAEVVKVLSQQSGRSDVEFKVANIKQISGVVRTLQQASKITHGGGDMTQQQIADSKLVTASSLAILSDATATEDQSVMLVEGGAIEGIVQVIEDASSHEETVVECVNVLCKLAAHQSERVTTKLADGGVVPALLMATKAQHQSQPLAESATQLLLHMVRGLGVERCQIGRETMQMVVRMIATFPNSTIVQEEGAVLLGEIQQGLGGDAQTLAVNYARESVQAAKPWQAVWDASQSTYYYYNSETQGTQWDCPKEYTEMAESVAALERDVVVEGLEDSQVAGILNEAMADHGGANVEVVKTVVRAFGQMTLDDTAAAAFCNAPGAVHSLIGLVDANNAEPSHHYDVLPACLSLLEKLAGTQVFKDMAAGSGVVATVNQCILNNLHTEQTVEKCVGLLVKLSYQNKVNARAILDVQAVHTLQSVMQSYPALNGLLSNCLRLLSNLMVASGGGEEGGEVKRSICEICVCEVLEVVRRLAHEAPVLKMALRCIGNLATDDANIRTIVSQHATQAIVDAMAHQAADPDLLQLAIEVIQNFSSLEEDEDDEDADNDGDASVYLTITEEKGSEGIIAAMRANMQEPELLVAGMDALGNISVDGEAAAAIVEAGGTSLVIDVFQSHDWHEELIESACNLLEHLTDSDCEGGADAATDANCLPVLLLAMKDHARYGNFMQHAGSAIVNLAQAAEENRETIRSQGGIDTILGLMEKGGSDAEEEEVFLNVALNVLTKLSIDDEISSLIATSGTHVLTKVARDHFDNDELLEMIFELIAQLAFIADNVLCLVQYSGIELIFDAIEKHLKSEKLMVKCIATIDHITMADEEYAMIVCEAKGKEYVEEIMAQYTDNEHVQEAGRTALVSISAMQNLATKFGGDIDEDEMLAKAELTSDPLEDYRALLTSGSVLMEWKSGKPASKHVLISPDMQAIVLKDTKKNAKKGVMMPLKSVKMISEGLGKGHKARFFGKKAKEDRAFNVIGLHDEVISLTCNLPMDADRWVAALKALLDTYKNHRKWLVKT